MKKLKIHAELIQKSLRMHFFNKAILVLSLIFIPTIILLFLDSQGILNLPTGALSGFRALLIIIGALLAASIIVRITTGWLINSFSDVEPEEKLLIKKIYNFGIYALAIVISLWLLGVTISNITLLATIMATGLAFAVRDILTSYFAWFMLLTKKPFRIGDYIRIGDIEGKVLHIGTFHVLLDDSPDDKDDFIRVPNRMFLEQPFANYGRDLFSISITYPLAAGKLDKDLEVIRIRIEKASKTKLNMNMSSDSSGVRLILTGKASSFEERDRIRDASIKILASEIPFKG